MIAVAALLALLSAEPEGPVLDIAGCEVRPSVDTCVLKKDRKLVIISSEPGDITYDFGGTKTTTKPEVVEGWFRVRIEAPANARWAKIHTTERAREFHFVAHPYPLADQIRLSSFDEDARISALSNLLGRASADDRPYLLRSLARLEHAAGRPLSSLKTSLEVIRIAQKDRQLSLVLQTTLAAANIHATNFAYAEAGQLLQSARQLAVHYIDGNARFHYHQGIHHQRMGRHTSAIGAVRWARNVARATTNRRLEAVYTGRLGLLLVGLGREAGLSELARAVALSTGCHRAVSASNQGWAAYLLGNVATATAALKTALEAFDDACPAASHLQNARLNAALALVAANRFDDAQSMVSLIEPRTFAEKIWTEFTALHARPSTSLRTRTEELGRIVSLSRVNMEWRLAGLAALELAVALRQSGRRKEAATVLMEALNQHYVQSTMTKLIEGGLADSVSGAKLLFALIDILIESDRSADARRAIQRHIAEEGLTQPVSEPSAAEEIALRDYREIRRKMVERQQQRWSESKPNLKKYDIETNRLHRQQRDVVLKLRALRHVQEWNHDEIRWPDETLFIAESEEQWLILGQDSQTWLGTSTQARQRILEAYRRLGPVAVATERRLRGEVVLWFNDIQAIPSLIVSVTNSVGRQKERHIGFIVDPDLSLTNTNLDPLVPAVSLTALHGPQVTLPSVKKLTANASEVVFIGHHDRLTTGETGIRLSGGEHWTALDVTQSERLPTRIALIMCQGIGNEQPGLHFADELLRHGVEEVLTTTRLVNRAEAEGAVDFVLQHWLPDDGHHATDLPLARLIQIEHRE